MAGTKSSPPGRKPHLSEPQLQRIAELFAVLSEPTRLRILHLLQDGPAGVGQIVAALGIKQANASKQLGILHQAGILQRNKLGNRVEYAIRMPLVFDICQLVCNGLVEEARSRLKQLT